MTAGYLTRKFPHVVYDQTLVKNKIKAYWRYWNLGGTASVGGAYTEWGGHRWPRAYDVLEKAGRASWAGPSGVTKPPLPGLPCLPAAAVR